MKKIILTLSVLIFVSLLVKNATALNPPQQIRTVYKFLSQPQTDKTYPQDSNSDDYDKSFLPAISFQFISFKKQGYILISPKNAGAFEVFINGAKLDCSALKDGKIYKIDISQLTKNGSNFIEVLNISTAGTVRIQTSYPEIIEDLSSYKDSPTFKLIDDIIEAEVRNGFPSAQLVVIKDGVLIKRKSYGYVNNFNADNTPIPLDERIKVMDETLFDLASNTKMFAVNYAVQKLVSDGKLALDDLVSKHINGFKDSDGDKFKGKDKMKIKDLLWHQAGFPADPAYHNDRWTGNGLDADGKNILFAQDKKKTLEMIIKTPLIYETGSKTLYSDVDYMLLGLIVEKISGKSLDKYLQSEFFKPLGLKRITFNPLKNGFKKREIAATELKGKAGAVYFENERTQTIWGEVHDGKAYHCFDGIAGHAGLFSNALDLAKLAQVMINRGGYGDKRFFSAQTVELFIKPKDSNDTYALGWRRLGESFKYAHYFSKFAHPSTIGHTGWTGTITVIDPVNNAVIVLLTSTRNSPAFGRGEMEANKYLTGGYGLIMSLVFSAFINDTKEVNKARIKEIVKQKRVQIKRNPSRWNNEPSRKSLEALIYVMENYK
jgi:CubicO group peptidase (beta-lactamase class C family)